MEKRDLILKKKVLILGSSGLIGHQVHNYLSDNSDFNLFNIAHSKKLNNETILLDARNERKLFNEIKFIQPNYIINCIGILINGSLNDPENAIFLNAYLPHRLSTLATEINSKLIHMSTDCVFSGNDNKPYVESDEKDGIGVYSKTKSLGELGSTNHLTIRTSVIGPELTNRSEELFNWFMSQSGDINGFNKSIWSGVTTLELAKSIKWFIENNTSGLYQLSNGLSISKYELLMLINENTNKRNTIHKIDGIFSDKSFIDTRKEINYALPGYSQMISEMVLSIKNNRSLYKHYNL